MGGSRLRLWAGLGLVGLLAAACGGGSDGDVATLPTVAPSETSTSAPDPGAAPTTVAPGGTPLPSPTARPGGGGGGGGGGVTPTPAPTPGPGPGGPVALAPAPPGTYRYDTSGVTTVGLSTFQYPAVTTLVVDPPAGTRQHSTRDLRDPAGNGPVLQLVLDYRAEGIFLEQLHLTNSISGFTNVRDLRPASPALFVPTGAGPGARQEIELVGSGSTAHLVVEVQRQERLTVGGQGVDTLVMRMLATLPPGEITGTLDVTGWLAPSVRFWVKERSTTAATAGGLVRFESNYEATLQRLP